jgi:SRSO17 transposase
MVLDALGEDGTMVQSDASTDGQLAATPDEATHAVQGGLAYLADLERRLAPYCERAEPRRRTIAYLRGLRSPAERKNSWQLAEISGEATPYACQHLLRRALWDADAGRDALRWSILDHRRDPEAVLVIDETGVLKKGQHSAGVARQYSGTAGRVEPCQSGVFVAYASRHGQVLLDRELSLPKEWTGDPARCQRAGIPQDRQFATKPQLAQQLLARAFAADVPATWVTGASVDGDDRRLRLWLESCPQAYVLAVSGKEYVWLDGQQRRVNTLLATLPGAGWTRLSAGDGAKGPRWYDWRGAVPGRADRASVAPLVRRSVGDPTDLTAYVVYAPQEPSLEAAGRVAGTRWAVESCFEAAKREVGRDHDDVRSWTGGVRHITLAMWALALLAVLRAGAVAVDALKKSQPSQGLSSLTAFKASRGLGSR